MKKFRNFIVSLVFLVALNSCGAIQDGFSLQKKDNTDEFLVQKKNPIYQITFTFYSVMRILKKIYLHINFHFLIKMN